MLSLSQMLDKVMVGNDAGWALTFHTESADHKVVEKPALTISRDDYYAEIQATLPGGLESGRYRFFIEGMTDDHYGQIAQTGSGQPSVVRLYLYWRDTIASRAGYLASLGGLTDLVGGLSADGLRQALVAELSITKVSHRVGTRRYEAVIEASERAFYRLKSEDVREKLATDSVAEAVETLCTRVGVPFEGHGLQALPTSPSDNPGDEQVSFDARITARRAMEQIGDALADITEKYGRGMLLIRDGKLHVGPRPIPLAERPSYELNHANGLLAAEPSGSQQSPAADSDSDSSPGSSSSRPEFTLTLKGRPDIKPGDMASFHPAPEDGPTSPTSILGAVVGSFLGPLVAGRETGDPLSLYVQSVEHKLGRTSGFVTTVTGVVIEDTSDPWDATAGPGNRGGTANGVLAAVQGVHGAATNAASAARRAEVGEVREMHSKGAAATEPPGQTLRLWRGLVRGDGRANQARRLAIRRRKPAVFDGVPYASPFAWGKCGLILPRYPGTRVFLVHRNGEPNDPVEVGALWESGHGPDSNAGDWWLILPAEVKQSDRARISDSSDAPSDYQGSATNDLIDADGNRVIEVGELTVRVGTLQQAGHRPERGSEQQGITIEHADGGARITIDKNGKIVIHAKEDLELVSEQGDIKLSAAKGSVDVSVQSEMNVH